MGRAPGDIICSRTSLLALIQVMACHLLSSEPLPGPMHDDSLSIGPLGTQLQQNLDQNRKIPFNKTHILFRVQCVKSM